MNRPVTFALAVVLGATAARAAEPPIRIGQVIPITGEAAEAGRYHKYGAELAVERSEEHTSELQSQSNLVCRLLLEKKKRAPRAQLSTQTSSQRRRVCMQRVQ